MQMTLRRIKHFITNQKAKDVEAKRRKEAADAAATISKVRSLLWCIGNQTEKVPGSLQHLLKLLYPGYTEDERRLVYEKVNTGFQHCTRR